MHVASCWLLIAVVLLHFLSDAPICMPIDTVTACCLMHVNACQPMHAGFHLHFLFDDRQRGGHLLNCTVEAGATVTIQEVSTCAAPRFSPYMARSCAQAVVFGPVVAYH